MSESDLVEAIDEGVACSFFDESAEGDFGHIDESGYFSEGYGFVVVVVHVFEGFLYASAVVGKMFVGEADVGEGAHVAGDREVVEDGEEFQYRVEAVLLIEGEDAWSEGLGRFAGEENSFLGSFYHVADKAELIPAEEFVFEQVFVPLDRDLADLFAFALMGKPGVIEIGADEDQLHIIYAIDVIADNATSAFGIDDKIEFEFFMIMQGETEFFFDAGEDGEAVILRERSYFADNVCVHLAAVCCYKCTANEAEYNKDEIKKYILYDGLCRVCK
jgi:hypothetical protein